MLSQALLGDFNIEAENTLKVFQAVPEEHFGWQPHEKSMSLAQLAGHIAESPGWIQGMVPAVFDFATIADEYKPFIPENRDQLIQEFERTSAQYREMLADKDDAFLEETWTMKSGDQVLMAAPRHAAIRNTIIHHTIHHRGQLTVYLRLRDTAVPPTYGPTADTPAMA